MDLIALWPFSALRFIIYLVIYLIFWLYVFYTFGLLVTFSAIQFFLYIWPSGFNLLYQPRCSGTVGRVVFRPFLVMWYLLGFMDKCRKLFLKFEMASYFLLALLCIYRRFLCRCRVYVSLVIPNK